MGIHAHESAGLCRGVLWVIELSSFTIRVEDGSIQAVLLAECLGSERLIARSGLDRGGKAERTAPDQGPSVPPTHVSLQPFARTLEDECSGDCPEPYCAGRAFSASWVIRKQPLLRASVP